MNKVEDKFLKVLHDNGFSCLDLKAFLHQMFHDRKIEDRLKNLKKIHPWFVDFADIYKHLKQSTDILDFVQFIEEDDVIEVENKQMLIHWLCTNFPSAFPLLWSVGNNNELFIETFDNQSIRIPDAINIKSLCEAIKKVVNSSCSQSILTEELTFELNLIENNHWRFFCQHNHSDRKLLITINEKCLIDFLDSTPIVE